jgi:hypothetical protein
MNWALILAIVWLLLAVPAALLIGHAIHRSDEHNSGSSRATPQADGHPTTADGRPTTAAGPAQGPRIVGAQPARRPRAR